MEAFLDATLPPAEVQTLFEDLVIAVRAYKVPALFLTGFITREPGCAAGCLPPQFYSAAGVQQCVLAAAAQPYLSCRAEFFFEVQVRIQIV